MARKMKDSGIEWIGEIPEGWEVVKAKYLFAQRNEKGNSALVLLSPTQKYGVIPQSQLEGVVQVKETTDLRAFKTIHIGDFVISLRSFQGGFEFSNYEGVCSPAYQVFHATKDLSNDFFRYLFKSDGFISKINSLTVGIREGKNIQYWDFSNMLLALPPKEVQIRSAQYLNAKCTKIDTMLFKTRSSIEEYKKLKQAVITQAVTKGVCGEREMKDSGVAWIGKVPKEWDVRKLKAVSARINVGVVIRPSEYFDDNGTVPFLRGINVKEYTISSENMVYISQTSNRALSKSQVHTGDILIVRDGNIGASCVVPSCYNGANVVSMVIVTPNNCDSRFLCYSLNSEVGKTQFTLTKIGSALTHTSVSAVSDILSPVPSREEQYEIADYLDAKCAEIDGLIAKKEQLVKELESYKKSLIYEVVTGKREV